MIKAKKLKPGSTIGIISPSYWIDENILKNTSRFFSDQNYKLIYGKIYPHLSNFNVNFILLPAGIVEGE